MPLLYFVEAMLRHPIVLIPLVVVVAFLYGAGKEFGLPRLFWHERRDYRFYAGAATTLLSAEVFLVAYLLDGTDDPTRSTSYVEFLLVGAAGWLVLVGFPSLRQHRRYRRSKRPDGGPEAYLGVTPAIRTVDAAGLSSRVALQVSAGALIAGVVLGAAVACALVLLARSDLVTPLVGLLSAVAEKVDRPLSDPRLHFLALISFTLLLAAFVLLRDSASPGLGLCLLLALGLAFYAAVEFWARSAGLGLVVVLLLLWWAGGSRYKLRVPPLMDAYSRPLVYPPRELPPEMSRPAPLPFDAALALGKPRQSPRPLILVCASGGGIRAATWTAAILGRLDEIEGFRAATRLLTGASGGMMGAAAWLGLMARESSEPRNPASPVTWRSLMRAVAMDSLTPVARQLVFHDFPLAFIERDNLQDRGLSLENAWCENLKSKLGINLRLSLEELRHGEETGRWPSLVLSPMMIEDGRRLLISNLDLSEMSRNRVRWLSSKDTGTRPTTGVASRAAYQLWQLCPETWGRFPLSTAARLSAAFPYVSGAVLLPTEPRRHVVDAGYYDNYGVELAGNWLRELLEQRQSDLKGNISGILVIQIRDNVSHLSVNPESDAEKEKIPGRGSAGGSRLLRALEGLSSPPVGLVSARDSVMLFRNDSLLESLYHLYKSAFGKDFLTTTVFEFAGEASLSWHLAPEEVQRIGAQAASPGIQLKLEAIESWLEGRGYWEQPRQTSA